MVEWTQEAIRFRMDAAERVGFDETIAAQILPHLPPNAHVCDAGCGLGYLSLALSRGCASVTAVDTSAAALAALRENAARAGASNIRAVQDDLFFMRPKARYDAMVFCFFGQTGETLRAVRAQCAGRAFLIKRGHAEHRFSLTNSPASRLNFQRACAELTALKVPFFTETFSAEMGQPLLSLLDAERFFAQFGTSGHPLDAAQIQARLTKTGMPEFPYFLSAKRMLGMIVLDARDIPDSI